jgi:ribosomal protein S18 acetylase RimI-like enzyme
MNPALEILVRPYRSPEDDAGVEAMRTGPDPVRTDHPPALVAAAGDAIVGFSAMDWWDEADGTRLYLLSGCVHPKWRRRGVGRRLLAAQEELAAARWLAQPDAARAITGVRAGDDRPDVQALLRAAGYRVRFTVVGLARDTAGAADLTLPDGLVLRAVQADHHPLIHEVLQECFAGRGLGQEARDWTDYRRGVRDTDLWLVAWAGDRIAAVLINERERDGTVDTPWLAVRPSWRRRGVAQALLQLNLHRLAAQGITRATIRTVQENPDHTVELYERMGYRVTARHPRWAKPLGGQQPAGQR